MSAAVNKPAIVPDGGGKPAGADATPPHSAAAQKASWLAKVAFVAAGFSVLVGGGMLYQHSRATERDPWKSPQLLALKEQLRVAPKDEAVKAEIRRLDLEFRQRYVRRLSLNQTGGWLLVGGLTLAVLTAQTAWKLRAPVWLPKRNAATTDAERAAVCQGRLAVTSVGLVAGVSLLILGWRATTPLPRSAQEFQRRFSTTEAPVPTAEISEADFRAHWPEFRGFGGRGVVTPSNAFNVGAATVRWQTPVLAPGFNSPVVWSNHLFFSGATAGQREVFCYDVRDGKLLWQRSVVNVPGSPPAGPELPEMTGYAASTMATDGQRAFVIFPHGDLAAFSFAGTLVWAKHLGVPKNMYGHAASLAIWPGKVIVQWDQDDGAAGGSKLLAFEAATGRTLWESAKPTHGSWATPIIAPVAGQSQIITLAIPWLMSHALADGRELWRADLMSGEIAPSPLAAGGLVFGVVPSGELIALRPDGAGDVTKTHVLWLTNECIPDITSPIGNDDFVFTITTMGGLACYATATGTMYWQKEFEFEVQATPALVGEQVVVVGTHGELVTVQAGKEFKQLSRTTLPDTFHASPAFGAARMFLRGATNLWCLGEQ